VKKLLRIIAFSGISILYCLLFGWKATEMAYSPSVYAESVGTERVSYFSEGSSRLLYHVTRLENAINLLSNIPVTSVKKAFSGFSALEEMVRQISFNKLSRYNYLSQNLLVGLQKTDIIFPFHYFW
jgi:hypothetical protein